MKWIKNDLKEIIEKYLEGNDFHKPLMIIVRTNHGSSNPIVDDCHDWMVEDLKAFWFQESPTYGLGYLSNYKIERIADHQIFKYLFIQMHIKLKFYYITDGYLN